METVKYLSPLFFIHVRINKRAFLQQRGYKGLKVNRAVLKGIDPDGNDTTGGKLSKSLLALKEKYSACRCGAETFHGCICEIL